MKGNGLMSCVVMARGWDLVRFGELVASAGPRGREVEARR
jgi:hypothetical protein